MDAATKSFAQLLYDGNIRPEVILHLGTQCIDDPYVWPDAVRELFEDEPEVLAEALGIAHGDQLILDDIPDVLAEKGKTGYLVQFSTPIPTQFSESGKSHTFSWGYYTLKWVYGETYEEACEKALQWGRSFVARKRAEALGKQ